MCKVHLFMPLRFRPQHLSTVRRRLQPQARAQTTRDTVTECINVSPLQQRAQQPINICVSDLLDQAVRDQCDDWAMKKPDLVKAGDAGHVDPHQPVWPARRAAVLHPADQRCKRPWVRHAGRQRAAGNDPQIANNRFQ